MTRFAKTLLTLIILVVLAIVGFSYFKNDKPVETPIVEQPAPVIEEPAPQAIDTSGWKTFSDKKNGVTFKYPENIPTTYIHTQDWPPKVGGIDGDLACAGYKESGELDKTTHQVINGHDYCIKKESEGAAGSTYISYEYIRTVGDTLTDLTFTLREVQCGNYDDPKKTECENERESFDIGSTIDTIFSTLKLSEIYN